MLLHTHNNTPLRSLKRWVGLEKRKSISGVALRGKSIKTKQLEKK